MGQLRVGQLARAMAWLNTGTHEALLQAGNLIETIDQRLGLKVACLEEIAFDLGYINTELVLVKAKFLEKTEYGKYLKNLTAEKGH